MNDSVQERISRVAHLGVRNRWPLLDRAHAVVARAKREGRLTPKPCVCCGDGGRTVAHHACYKKPMLILWLCFSCHRRAHLAIRDAEIEATPRAEPFDRSIVDHWRRRITSGIFKAMAAAGKIGRKPLAEHLEVSGETVNRYLDDHKWTLWAVIAASSFYGKTMAEVLAMGAETEEVNLP